jgi:hypothetical protein
MKRILSLILLLCAALSGIACKHVGPNGLTAFATDWEQVAYERDPNGTVRYAATGVSTSKPITAIGSTITTLGSQQMISKIAGGWFKSKNTEVIQAARTERHLATQASATRLAEIEATKPVEEAAAATLPVP